MYFIKVNPRKKDNNAPLIVVDSGGQVITFDTRQAADAYAFKTFMLRETYEICEMSLDN